MRVLAVGDTHAPYQHPAALDFLRDLKRQYKPDRVIHIGDIGDQHGWSRHDPDPDGYGPRDEDAATAKFIAALGKLFPKVDVCIGNHDERIAKGMARARLPTRLTPTYRAIYQTPRWWRFDYRFTVDRVLYTHGEAFGGESAAMKAAKHYRRSCVIGHVHTEGGVRFHNSGLDQIFGASTGCLVDGDSAGMSYARASRNKSILGSVVVLDGVPVFVPLKA